MESPALSLAEVRAVTADDVSEFEAAMIQHERAVLLTARRLLGNYVLSGSDTGFGTGGQRSAPGCRSRKDGSHLHGELR